MSSIYNRLLFAIGLSIIGAPPAAVALRYNAKNTIVIGHLKPDADSIGVATNNNILNAQKFVSRKLHIVPMLMDYFSKD